MKSPIPAIASLALFLTACGGGAQDEPSVGPCVHRYADPLIRLESVSNDLGLALGVVTVSEVRRDGVAVEGEALMLGSVSVVRSGNSLSCTLPCGLFQEEGRYRFVLAAAGHQPKTVEVDAKYRSFTGGCPSTSSGSTPLTAQLMRLAGS